VDSPKVPEIELARALLAGEPDAFERFVDIFRSKLFQYTFLMCGQRDDAEEVVQETLLNVFRSLDQLREPENVKAWVFRIAKNACLMKRRRSIFAPAEELSLDNADGLGSWEIRDPAMLPDGELLRLETRELLTRAISELPENYRAVLLLRDVEELSTEETAQILDVSTDVVKTRLHRARLALRDRLKPALTAPHLAGVE
jgi:RNA polymerase sigma-70 factor, ECF subfamily